MPTDRFDLKVRGKELSESAGEKKKAPPKPGEAFFIYSDK
jgi:hypothetical protein